MSKQSFTTGQVLTAAQVNSLQANDYNQTVSVKTASYVLVAADKGTRIEFNTSGSVTCTVNSGLFDAGDTLVIQNRGAGTATVTAGTATVNTSASLVVKQYDSGVLYFVSDSSAIYFASDAADTPLTTKGDLFTFSTAPDRIAIGANNTVLTADSTQATGMKWATLPSSGKVLQVVQAVITTATTIASTSYTDTNLTATITPSSTASKILVSVSQSSSYSRSGIDQGIDIRLLRGATDIFDQSGSDSTSYILIQDGGGINYVGLTLPIAFDYLDSPSTTSATTYKTQAKVNATTNSGSSTFQQNSSKSVITLMEIGA